MYKKIGISIMIFTLLSLVISPIVSSEEIGSGSIIANNQDGHFSVNSLNKKIILFTGVNVRIYMKDGSEIQIKGRTYSDENSFKIEKFYGFGIQFWSGTQQVPYEDSKLYIYGFGIGISEI